MRQLFFASVAVALATTSLHAHDKIERRGERDLGNNLKMEFVVTYLDPQGHTIADASGIYYHHDALSAQWNISPSLVTSEARVLPGQYFGSYPLYYGNSTMRYQIKLTNTGQRTIKRLTVVAIQEYLNAAGQIGVRIGSDAVRDWFVAKLKKGESTVLEGSISIPSAGESGLDQTHIQVFKSRKNKDEGEDAEGPTEQPDNEEREEARHHNHGQANKNIDRVIFEDVQAGIWCPPASQPTKP